MCNAFISDSDVRAFVEPPVFVRYDGGAGKGIDEENQLRLPQEFSVSYQRTEV